MKRAFARTAERSRPAAAGWSAAEAMSGGGLVWVTRAEPGASRTGAKVWALGRMPLVAPLLQVRALEHVGLPELNRFGALAFTSANGVHAFAALTPRRDLPVWAVGAATAEAARAAGFNVRGQGEAGVNGLAERLAAAPEPGPILHPCAAEPAGDLAGALLAAGVPAETLPVYATTATSELPPAARSALEDSLVTAVLLHSPKAAHALAGLCGQAAISTALAGIVPLGLSPACLSPLPDPPFTARRAAPTPDEAALLALLA